MKGHKQVGTKEREALFAYKHNGGKGGIYMMLHGKERMVCPYALYEALWDGREKVRLCHGVEARFVKWVAEVEGCYFDEDCGCYRETYTTGEFVDTAIGALKTLCQEVCSFVPTHYEKMRPAHAERMMEGLLSGVLERRRTQIFADDIVGEDFRFSFVEEYGHDTGFALSIGGREFRSMMTDWSNSYDLIRHEMERFAMESHNDDRRTLKINHEDLPNTIEIRHCTIHGNGRYNDVAKVTFTPDAFVGGPILFGWCKQQQVLKALYLGMLGLFVRESKRFDGSERGVSWNEYRLTAYNKLQSCIIEDYLMGTDADDLIYRQRQRIVHTVAEMKADYAALMERLSSIFFLLNME